MLVNRAWKDVVVSDPSLWSTILIDDACQFNTQMVATSIKRAKSCLLHLHLDIMALQIHPRRIHHPPPLLDFLAASPLDLLASLFEILAATLPQCGRITFHGHDPKVTIRVLRHLSVYPCPALTELEMDLYPGINLNDVQPVLPPIFGGVSPPLKRLVLRTSLLPLNSPVFRSVTLTELTVENIYSDSNLQWSDLKNTLEGFTSLIRLRLLDVACSGATWFKPMSLCVLPSVTHLEVFVYASTVSAAGIMGALRLPALTTFKTKLARDHPYNKVALVLPHHFASHVRVGIFSVDDKLADVISQFQNLEVLDCRGVHSGRAVLELFRDGVQGVTSPFLPNIRRIIFGKALDRGAVHKFLLRRIKEVSHGNLVITCPMHESPAGGRPVMWDRTIVQGELIDKAVSVPDLFYCP
ncbi:hypothetical protein DFH09DRAFT_1348538 [Mycena vulgaris]|nr:hypothetical protein DFH09DRAFT_1348538 [Mycena vulgaris]